MQRVLEWLAAALILLGGTCVLLGLGGALHPVLDAIGFFRPHFGILAGLGGLLALVLGRYRGALVGVGLAVLAAVMLGPVWRGVERPAEAGAETRSITVMTANVLGGSNPDLDRTASLLVAANADILAIVEAPRAWGEPDSLLMRHYAHATARPGKRNGVFILSRFPLANPVYNHPDRATSLFGNAVADVGGAPLGVTVTHFSWPLVSDNAQQKQTGAIAKILPETAGPMLLMGDFNAPPWSEAMGRVENNSGLAMIGGLRRTWLGAYPNPLRFMLTGEIYRADVPAILGHQIDHILLSPDIGVEQIEVIPLPGSDHDAVWARITVPLRTPRNLYASRQ